MEKWEIFKKNFNVYQRENLKCLKINVRDNIKKKLYQIDQVFFVIFVKNNNYSIDQL